jgi:hypothetical protein
MYEPTRRKPERKHSDWAAAHGATQRALKADKRPPTDADQPPPSTFPGRKAEVISGQLALSPAGDWESDTDTGPEADWDDFIPDEREEVNYEKATCHPRK